jgi:hypothetical protein
MSPNLEIKAFLDEGGSRKPFYLRISKASRAKANGDYYCRVHAPELFDRDKDIFGIDKEQARELAIQFVTSMLAGKKLVDKNGEEVRLQNLFQ